MTFGEDVMELEPVEGEEEEAFLQKTRESMERGPKGSKRGGGRGFQGRGHHRKLHHHII